jgi:predicted dehydrogenase
MTLKVGVVGVGNIGSIHAQVYHDNPKAELVAVCDIIQDKADAAAKKFGAKAYYSVQQMLSDGVQLDACSVCTRGEENGSEHYQPTIELLGAGIPVLGEKPISNVVEEGEEMVALARRKNIPYGVNLNHRFTPAAKRAKEWIESGRLGHLHTINMRMWINNPVETSPWFHMRALHPHSFDVMRYFCGDVKSVAAFMNKGQTRSGEARKTFSNAQVILQFENGVVGNLIGSYDGSFGGGSFGLERCEVAGSQAMFELVDACEHLHFKPRFSIETETYSYLGGMRSFGETFKSRIGAWVDQLEAKTPPDQIDGSGVEALKAQRIIEAAIRSFESHSVVDL